MSVLDSATKAVLYNTYEQTLTNVAPKILLAGFDGSEDCSFEIHANMIEKKNNTSIGAVIHVTNNEIWLTDMHHALGDAAPMLQIYKFADPTAQNCYIVALILLGNFDLIDVKTHIKINYGVLTPNPMAYDTSNYIGSNSPVIESDFSSRSLYQDSHIAEILGLPVARSGNNIVIG